MVEPQVALGDYRLGTTTAAVQELERVSEWRWADKDVIHGKPQSDYIGPGLDTIELNGVIYPHFRGGLGQVDAMRAEADKGTPLRMVLGTGQDMGLWTIRRISENQTRIYDRGIPLKVEFRLSLKEYRGS
ncbi:phage tail protein [Endozoicomonas gorgoniicola]|uniref:Phage tail protein n=1 Tax=Endozoicomonas gorgoniicola TaxID=1234144 RepID=A0ABT3MW82_9GAMM|nr:phage tail protein [Endozoicomonas gorgoniicola]MCW7553641.1 phage tail protein [Endozoicomonas gorgoniicola]